MAERIAGIRDHAAPSINVIPAEAGIQGCLHRTVAWLLDSRFRGNDVVVIGTPDYPRSVCR